MHRKLKTNGEMLFPFRPLEYQQGTLFGYEVKQNLFEKYNRFRLDIPKTHCLDAACTGQVDTVMDWRQNVLLIKAMGRGCYQRTRGQIWLSPKDFNGSKMVKGFATRDMVKTKVHSAKKKGMSLEEWLSKSPAVLTFKLIRKPARESSGSIANLIPPERG